MLALLILAAAPWVPLSNGVEWRSTDGFQVIRVSPPASLEVGSGDRRGGGKAVAAINASMFQLDGRTSAGHLHGGSLVNQRAWNPDYQSVLVFRPAHPGLPPFTIVDLDQSGSKETIAQYTCAVQN